MFVIFRNPNDYLKYIFDGYENKNVIFDKDIRFGLLNSIRKFHTSVKINRKYNLPLKQIWYASYLDYKKIDTIDDIYFVFFEGARMGYQKEYLEYLRKKYKNAKFIYRFVNPINRYNEWSLEYVKANFDMIISMDKANCIEYQWCYVSNTYNTQNRIVYESNEFDVFFVGSDKGRLNKLIEIYNFLTKKGLKCAFYVANVENKEQLDKYEGIYCIRQMSYLEILKYIKKSKCILEIVQEGQSGSTLRPMEAIVYRKKLLTSDRNIFYQTYYDSNNMFYFDKVEDIDVDFIHSEVIESKQTLENISHEKLFDSIKSFFKNNYS